VSTCMGTGTQELRRRAEIPSEKRGQKGWPEIGRLVLLQPCRARPSLKGDFVGSEVRFNENANISIAGFERPAKTDVDGIANERVAYKTVDGVEAETGQRNVGVLTDFVRNDTINLDENDIG
jgi:hypothetical protein